MKKKVFYIVSIILIAFMVYVGSLISFEERQKPANISQTAFWVGGLDGGVWVNIDDKKSDTLYYFTIYFENGDIWEKGWFKGDCIVKEKDIPQQMLAYDGEKIGHKDSKGNYCSFRIQDKD